MTQHVVVIDTSILCCWLQIPGKETAGPITDRWDYARVESTLRERQEAGSYFVLPFATIVETGNHIAQSNGDRYQLSRSLSTLIDQAANGNQPWIAFSEQSNLLEKKLTVIQHEWPELAARRVSLGDYLIKDVAEYYAKSGMDVEILKGDDGLKSFQPVAPVARPRRRQ